MTMVGYFNSLRELGGMKRLAEDDVQTRSYRVQMSMVERPGAGAAQRQQHPRADLARLQSGHPEVPRPARGEVQGRIRRGSRQVRDEMARGRYPRPIDVVLATNMLSVGVDVNRLG
jgi:hypothetical protein